MTVVQEKQRTGAELSKDLGRHEAEAEQLRARIAELEEVERTEAQEALARSGKWRASKSVRSDLAKARQDLADVEFAIPLLREQANRRAREEADAAFEGLLADLAALQTREQQALAVLNGQLETMLDTFLDLMPACERDLDEFLKRARETARTCGRTDEFEKHVYEMGAARKSGFWDDRTTYATNLLDVIGALIRRMRLHTYTGKHRELLAEHPELVRPYSGADLAFATPDPDAPEDSYWIDMRNVPTTTEELTFREPRRDRRTGKTNYVTWTEPRTAPDLANAERIPYADLPLSRRNERLPDGSKRWRHVSR